MDLRDFLRTFLEILFEFLKDFFTNALPLSVSELEKDVSFFSQVKILPEIN